MYKDDSTSYDHMLSQLKQDMPKLGNGFEELQASAIATATLDAKIKNLTALAIAVMRGSQDAFELHVTNAVRAGATRAEIVEAIGMAMMLGGEPVAFNGGKALQFVEELA
ncbi:MAG: carboxymuconolactone decarboxylase family protein [Chloroflexi bacterium]|nr:carboxymuconolactone decarboxylase family protein [Chloroflexota bacterium]